MSSDPDIQQSLGAKRETSPTPNRTITPDLTNQPTPLHGPPLSPHHMPAQNMVPQIIKQEELSVKEKMPLVPTETCSLLADEVDKKLEEKQIFLATQVRTLEKKNRFLGTKVRTLEKKCKLMATLARTLQSSSNNGSHTPIQGMTQHQSHIQGTDQQYLQSQDQNQMKQATCFCCGYRGHRRYYCKFKDASCHNCRKAGHVKSNCGFIPGTSAYVAYERKKQNNWQSQASSQTVVAPQFPQVSQTTSHVANTQPSNSSKPGQGAAQHFCARHGSGVSHTTADCRAIKKEQQKSGEGVPASSVEMG